MSYRSFALAAALASASLLPLAHAQQMTMPLWPHASPQAPQTSAAEMDNAAPGPANGARHSAMLTNVTHPSLTVYLPPPAKNTHAAALVFPGGGYQILAYNKEGTDTCDWLNHLGMACILVKYRVPEVGRFPDNPSDLQDAQQAMRLTRAHAAEWHIDPGHVGVVGFSAGGNLATLLSLYPDDHTVETTPAGPDVNATVDARPSFTILIYPAYLAVDPQQVALDPVYTPSATTPRTFIVAAENDTDYGKNSLVYYRALLDAKRPAELHMFAGGGHGFGVYPRGAAGHWPDLAAQWLRTIHILPPPAADMPSTGGAGTDIPCPMPQPPTAGRPTPTSPPASDPNCPDVR